jgi:hypothetical protein
MARPKLTAKEKEQLQGLMQDLWRDAGKGDLDTSRARLRLHNPATARLAVLYLGVPYLQKVKKSGDAATFNGATGKAAVEDFIEHELRPLVTAKATQKFRKEPQKKKLRRGIGHRAMMIAVTGLLAFGILSNSTGPANSDALAPEDRPTTELVTPADSSVTQLREAFNATALGRDMLKFADENGITIHYDATLSERGSHANYQAWDKRANVDSDLSLEDQVIYLSHELRHAWQHVVLGYDEMEDRLLTPEQRWTLRRFVEADAAAFSTIFLAERLEAFPDRKITIGTATFEHAVAAALRAEFKSDDGLTVEEFHRHAFEKAFADLTPYNTKHLSLAQTPTTDLATQIQQADTLVTNKNFAQARRLINTLKERLSTTPSDQEFDTWLRRFGGPSMDPAAQTALQKPGVLPSVLNTLAAAPAIPLPDDDSTNKMPVSEKLSTAEKWHQNLRRTVLLLERINDLQEEQAQKQQLRPTAVLPKKTQITAIKPKGPRAP